MSTVGAVARLVPPPSVKPAGGDAGQYPDVSAEGMPYTAWLVWQAAREKVPDGAQQVGRWGIPGYVWQGSVWGLVSDLWPLLSTSDQQTRSLYTYLRSTRNMVCVRRNPLNPAWWVTDTWQPANGRSFTSLAHPNSHQNRSAAQRRAEAEDAERSGPVTVTFRCRVCGGGPFGSRPERGAHEGHHKRQRGKPAAVAPVPDAPAPAVPVVVRAPARKPPAAETRAAEARGTGDAVAAVESALAQVGEAFRDLLNENTQLRQQLDQVRKVLG